MICPKCGRVVPEAAVICPACDFILDTDFLGEEILDEEKKLRPGRGGLDPQEFNLADAVILGDIDESSQAFETSDTGFHVKESTGARLYVSGRSQALMAPDAIPALIAKKSQNVRLTPFEKHVLTFIDGSRPVESIRREAGLDETEVKTALATLADKGVIEVVGRALVDLGVPESAMIRRPERRRIKRTIAGALGTVSDETDRAIEDAFKTRTGLSPINPGDLEPEAPKGAGDDVFSDLGPGGDDFDQPRSTNELLSLVSSSTPVLAPPAASVPEKKPGEETHGTFVPVSRTADPGFSVEASDGFDDFGSGTEQVDLGRISSSSSPPSSSMSMNRGSFDDEEESIISPGSEAIAHLANSQLIGQAMKSEFADHVEEDDAEQKTVAKIPSFSLPLSRLLSDAGEVDPGDEPFASLAGAPPASRPVPPPVLGNARSSSIASAEDGFSGFAVAKRAGQELDSEQLDSELGTGTETPVMRGRRAPDNGEETPVAAPVAEPQSNSDDEANHEANIRPGQASTGEIDNLLAALSEDGAPEDDSLSLGSVEVASPSRLSAAKLSAGPDSMADSMQVSSLLSLSPEAADSIDISSLGSPLDSENAASVQRRGIAGSSLDLSALADGDLDVSALDAGDLEDSDLDDGDEELPSHLETPPTSGLAPQTRVVDLSQEPALSELLGGFEDDSHFGPDSAVFEPKKQLVSYGEDSDVEETSGPPPVVSSDHARSERAKVEPTTGEVSKVFTRDGPHPRVASSEDEESSETTNLLEDPRLAAGFKSEAGAGGVVPLDAAQAARLGAVGSEEATALRTPEQAKQLRQSAQIEPLGGSSVEMVSDSFLVRPKAAAAPPPPHMRIDSDVNVNLKQGKGRRGLSEDSAFDESVAEESALDESDLAASALDESDLDDSDLDESDLDDSDLAASDLDDSDLEDSDLGERARKSGNRNAGEGALEDSIVDDSVLSELSADDSAYDPSIEAGGRRQTLVVNSAAAGKPMEHALPSSLIDDSALASEVERGIRSASGPTDDPNATAYVRSPTGLVSAYSGDESGVGWGEGTHEYEDEDDVSTGDEEPVAGPRLSVGGTAALLSSSGVGDPVIDRGDQGNHGSEQMREKARRLFRDALRDHKSGRASRAKQNIKLATIYDPENEEYRAQLEAWSGQGREPATGGKPREVLLYEEAQVLEREGEYDGAITLLKQGIDVNPRIAAFHNRLGVLLAIRKHNYDEAAGYVRHAIELEPDNMHYKSNYGKIVQKARLKGQPRA